jgi:competence ComEA-like helix-hairpin-helix protein
MKPLHKSDKDAIIILLIVIIIGLVVFPLVKCSEEDRNAPNKTEYAEKQNKNSRKKPQYYKVPEKEYELFYFDPNTADSTQLLRLGLQPWQVRNIYKYRAAGGRYRKPTDLARLYGLTLKQYKRLEPYIKIEKEVMAADVYKKSDDEKPIKKDSALIAYPVKIKEGEHIDINLADTSELKRIPGIGSYYAKRIVSFRQRLGGIANVHQLLEIQGFPESSLKYMSIGQDDNTKHLPPLTRIRINHLDLNALSRHPYIRYVQAKEIMNFRRLRGPIKKADDLRRLPSFSEEEVERVDPYIDYEP